MTISAYPLTWPNGWRRAASRARAAFHGTTRRYSSDGQKSWHSKTTLTVAEARKRLFAELDRLGANATVLSSSLVLNNGGTPRSTQAEPRDPGVAVYFKLKGKDRVLACDKWDRAADNIAAVAKHIEAMRGQARWGVGTLDQAFTGYAALPPPSAANRRPWRAVLNVGETITLADAEWAYRCRLSDVHPDRGGTHEQAAELNAAINEARESLSA